MADDDGPLSPLPEFDPLTAPLTMPRDVRRVNAEGFPTTAQLDWEQAFKNWTVQQTVKLNEKITTVRDESNNAFAEVTETVSTLAGDQEAIALSLTSLTTTVGGHTSSISSMMGSINGLGAQWAIQANIGGSYGGLVFTGVKKADGSGATYLLEIQSNVVINGDLTVNGSISNPKLANLAVTQVATASGVNLSGGVSASVSINFRGTGKVSVLAYHYGNPALPATSLPTMDFYVDSTLVESRNLNCVVLVTEFGSTYTPMQTTIVTDMTPSTGTHVFSVSSPASGGVRIWVFEGSK